MIGGRSIQAAQPSAEPTVVRNVFPTPQAPPKMVLPDPKQKPRAPARSNATSKDPLGTARGREFETQLGTARADTGAKGQGFGLSSSGGGGGGGGSRLDTKDFCCPEYVTDMLNRIRSNWNQQQQAAGVVLMQFTIARNGQLTNIQVEVSSGNPLLDMASQRALMTTKSIAPLPAAFPDSQLPVHLEFRYER
jgi:TonB family protein